MGRAARRRKLQRALQAERRPRRPADRPDGERALLAPAYRAALAAMGFGMTVALAIVVVGLVLLGGEESSEVGAASQPAQESSRATEPSGESGSPAASPLDIAIEAEHRGNLELDILARVSIQGNALFKADVVAYTDMLQMPQAHAQGPLAMEEVEPGIYTTRTAVPMVGDYEVRVEVRSPVTGEGRKVVPVAVVAAG